MFSPLVSVCIPTYRGAEHLAATISSVLAQSFSDFELVIVNDNSPDATDRVMENFSDPRIRYLKNTSNLGPEGNWNRCLKEARGRYFKLLPQDDLLYPGTLEKQIEILEQDGHQEIALVFGSRDIIDAQDKIITRRSYPGGAEGVIPAKTLVRRCVQLGTNLIGEPGGVLVRKELADQVGSFNGEIGYIIDLDYWVRLLTHGDAYYLKNPVSAFRVSGGSWSVAIGTRQSDEYKRFITKLRAEPMWHLRSLDVLAGNLMARLNNLMRLVFYRFVLNR